MCGIVGYLGDKCPKDVIVDGLKKLEYRGYDSAGISVLDKGEFKRVRAEGKLANLEKKLESESFDGPIGIGHTRWATHGGPTERNAHPHNVEGVSLVHNGIIENYAEIKKGLIENGVQFSSETDSELVAHLVASEFSKTNDLFKAVREVLPRLEGAFSILVMHESRPKQLVAFKSGPPLIVGLGENEYVVASDSQAIIAHTPHVVYMDDEEIAVLDVGKYQFYSANGFEIEKKIVTLDLSEELVEKRGYPHFMLKEIFEQPASFAAAIDQHIDVASKTVQLRRLGFGLESVHDLAKVDLTEDEKATKVALKGVERIFILACGTSYYAAQYAEYLIEKLAKIPVEIDVASEFRYRELVIPKNSLVMTISQSGETADTLAALRIVKEQGALTLSVCNVKNSTIDREAHGHLYMNAGTEVGVASTKALSSTMGIAHLFAVYLGKLRGYLSVEEEIQFVEAILAIPNQMDTVLAYDKYFDEASHSLKAFRGFLYLGRGVNYPMAMEGALKLKELAYLHAEGYAAGEMKHGPLALIDERMAIVMVAPMDELYEKTLSNLEEARARGGYIISIGTGKDDRLQELSERYLSLPKSIWSLSPILALIPLQLMSYHLADSLGMDVDQPRNLAKSVTVE